MAVAPLPVTVPTVALPVMTPSTLQVTAVLEAPDTVAEKEAVLPVSRLAEAGVMTTLTGGAGTVMVDEAFFVVSARAMTSNV